MKTRPAPSVAGFGLIAKLFSWLSALLLAMVTAAASAQANPTVSQALRLQGFGVFSYGQPRFDYGLGAGTNYGFSVGADLDVNLHTWFMPGLEIRGTRSTGDVQNQFTYGGGPRIIFPLRRIQPYADFLISGGKIEFNQPYDPLYQANRSTVYSYGGGTDLVLTRGWAVKLDVQSQRWRLTHEAAPFHPLAVSVGVRYEVHNRRYGPE
jgi:hypothetical protein